MQSSTQRHQAYGHAGRVFGLAFHPVWGHNIIASASEDETVRVWCRTRPTDDWEQTSCCRGHQAEVLRVAWSPDGRILASGSADHTVRLWQVGTQGQFSYSGVELAVLKDHPGEVYGLKFLNLPRVVTQPLPAQQQPAASASAAPGDGSAASHSNGSSQQQAAAAGANPNSQPLQQQQQQQQSVQYDTLLTASGESMYLWDLTTGKIIHQSAPLPVMSTLRKLKLSSQSNSQNDSRSNSQGTAAEGSGVISNPQTGVGFAAEALNSLPQQQQQQQQGGGQVNSSPRDGSRNPAAANASNTDEDDIPSYIFSVAAADATNWLAAVCSDGMLRMWDASKRSLQEVAAVKVHPTDMGSCCSFVPQQPWLVLSLSKGGQAVLQDIRMLGRPLLQQQLAGPVYDMAWTVRDVPAEGLDAAATASSSSSVCELVLQVVGRDDCVRSYPFNRAALQAGQLQEPNLLQVGEGYGGRLLALASTLDGRTLAAAGEPVPADELKPWTPRQHQQQQQAQPQPRQQQQQQPADSKEAIGSSSSSSWSQRQQDGAVAVEPVTASAVAAAAAKRVSAAAGRRSRTKRAAVDLFDMEEGDVQSPTEVPQQQQAAADNQSAAAAASEAADGAKSKQSVNTEDYSDIVEAFAASVGVKVSDMPPEWAQMVAAAAAAGMIGTPGTAAGANGGGDCAAAAGVLTRAPLFTWGGL